jgi:hypothetical protein
MDFPRHKSGITRADLTRDCLRELRLWPGCETVEDIAVLADEAGTPSDPERSSADRARAGSPP